MGTLFRCRTHHGLLIGPHLCAGRGSYAVGAHRALERSLVPGTRESAVGTHRVVAARAAPASSRHRREHLDDSQTRGVRPHGSHAVDRQRGRSRLAVDTVAWLREQGHDASLVWDGDGPVRDQAQQRARERGIGDHVDFRGFRGTEDLWKDLAESTVFVLPSKSETFCVAAAEALAAGRPVIMGDQGGQGDFITERNGRMVSERSPEAFGRAVLDLTHDSAAASPQEMAREIRARYGSDAVSDQLTELYRRAQGGERRR
ncbi:MAG: hypothetical protein DI613_13590 [Kocuria rhizophila]|nr:MAG: hypothetical protein DI613_13590 [Kocuria rhizophila]